jgi:hypothetical protein
MHSGNSLLTFLRNVLPSCSGSKSKLSKQGSKQQAEYLFSCKDANNAFENSAMNSKLEYTKCCL